jgi:hypothetical protein
MSICPIETKDWFSSLLLLINKSCEVKKSIVFNV